MSGSLSASQALPLISQYESGNQNVLTAIQPAGGGNTASGYYQITNPTWQQYAPQAGVDLSQYPTAMSAPQSVQTSVAATIYNQRGLQPWSSNSNLMAAVSATDPTTVDPLAGLDGGLAVPAGNALSNALGATATAAAGSLLDPLWEIVSRGFLLIAGLALCIVALAALLWQSKTVQVGVRALA